MIKKLLFIFLMVFLVCQIEIMAQELPPISPEKEAELSKLSITDHSILIDKKTLNYTASTGHMIMKDESGKHQASIFFIAYTKDGKIDPSTRPITFVFNGGPGSSSIWLHMGALGPKRVKMSDEGFQLPQPFQYIDNESTWLEFTDLVFIDPVSTGYSRPAQGVDKKQFHGVKEDIQSIGDFIRLYVTRNSRWLSQKFLCGESYGTTRAAGLSGYLQDTYGMYLQGIVLISSVMNFQTVEFAMGNDLPCVLFLPTYTAAAWYHKKLPEKYQKDLKSTLEEVEKWALTDYHVALAKGDKLTKTEREEVIDKLVQYTGLSKKFIDKADLRIDEYSFDRELLKDEDQLVGRLDVRFKSLWKEGNGEAFGSDPSYIAIFAPFTSAANHYLRNDLKYVSDITYWPMTGRVSPWNWGGENGYVNVAENLRQAMEKNKNLKVMIANGYYDLATPYFATMYTVNHMWLYPEQAKNIIMKFYESGHMIYLRKVCLQKLRDDALEFYTAR